MQGVRWCRRPLGLQHKKRDRYIKPVAIGRHKKEAAVHATVWRAQTRTACVLERLTRVEQRLLADNAQSFDFVGLTLGIGDDPVP